MVISSNTLFHFTDSIDNLLNILTNEFRPHYCLENSSDLFVKTGEVAMAFPMICFCDLPLSQLDEHLAFYGHYGIGMKKGWGIEHGVNPVHYLHSSSPLSESIAVLMKYCFAAPADQIYVHSSIHELINYVKLYQGRTTRNRQDHVKMFYDEREWRWIPPHIVNSKVCQNLLTSDEFANLEKRTEADAKIFETAKLPFGPDDIKYIIVWREDDILPMINSIERIKGKYDKDTIQKLTSRIITAGQIMLDF
jgi:hypothetical protein